MNEISISSDDLRKVKLFVATPMYGGMGSALYFKSCLNLQTMCIKHGIEIKFSFLSNESLITRARNYLVDEFLRSGFTHLLFIDSDIDFNDQDILAMLAINKDVIGGPYPKKSINWKAVYKATKIISARPDFDESKFNPNELSAFSGEYVFNLIPGTMKFNVRQPVEVMEIGTGYMMIKRAVFDRFKQEYPHLSYKPDHVGQPDFDGQTYIHAYFDTVIDPDSHRYLSEDYMFCSRETTSVLTESGYMRMGDIVNNKYNGKVLSFDIDGNSSWQKVTNWSRRKEKKDWVKLNTNTNNSQHKLKITSDHRIAILEDVLKPEISWDKAENTTGKYVVRYSDDRLRVNHKENKLFNEKQLSALIGSLLGDGTIAKSGQVAFTHCDCQYDYIEEKARMWGGKVSLRNGRGYGKDKPQHYLHIPINAQTKKLRDLLYITGKKKIGSVLSMVDERALAYWYMDDGGLHDGCARLAVGGFDEQCVNSIVKMLSDRYDVTAKVNYSTAKSNGVIKRYPYIRLNIEDSKKFFSLIAKYVVPTMRYKLPEHYWNVAFEPVDNKYLDFAAALVKSVEPIKDQGDLYDIEVENNHNFIADNTLVHNCQYWRAIGGQIWLCPWMATQHIGTHAYSGSMLKIAEIGGQL